MTEILNKCYQVSIKTIGAVLIFVVGIAFAWGVWATSISDDIKDIKTQVTSLNSKLEEHYEKSDAVVKRAERVTTLVANKCCSKSVAAEIDAIMYPN